MNSSNKQYLLSGNTIQVDENMTMVRSQLKKFVN